MKTMDELHARIRAEVDQWFKRQCENIYDDFYLYYLQTTPEHIGGIFIAKDKPANEGYQLVEKIRKDFTKEQVVRRITTLAWQLPIMEY